MICLVHNESPEQHAGDPGSIPGGCIVFLDDSFWMDDARLGTGGRLMTHRNTNGSVCIIHCNRRQLGVRGRVTAGTMARVKTRRDGREDAVGCDGREDARRHFRRASFSEAACGGRGSANESTGDAGENSPTPEARKRGTSERGAIESSRERARETNELADEAWIGSCAE